MTVQTVPYALQNASHSAALFRQSASAPIMAGGVPAANELLVTQQASPNMSVLLKPGRAKITGSSVSPPSGLAFTTQAMYDSLNDADFTLSIAASNPTNPRIDLVYIQVQDAFYSGSNNQAIPGVVTGTPAGSPSIPATPANAIALYTIAVGASVTTIVNANIARVVNRLGLVGGLLNFRTTTERDTWTTAYSAGLILGDRCSVSTRVYVWNGTIWVPVRSLFATTSSTGTINGSNNISWTDPASALNGMGIDTDVYWASGNADRVTFPFAGTYEVAYTGRTNAAAPLTVVPMLNGSTSLSFASASAVGTSGAATSAGRSFFITVSAGQYLTFTMTSNAVNSGLHNVAVQYFPGI